MRTIARNSLGALFILAGLNHFRRPNLYKAIMPDYLPRHAELVALSGYAEVALGAAALLPRLRGVARWGLIALLLAVFPANVYMAAHPERYPMVPRWLLWVRLPLQGALIGWVWLATSRPASDT